MNKPKNYYQISFKPDNYKGYITQLVESPAQALQIVQILKSKEYPAEIIMSQNTPYRRTWLTEEGLEEIA